MALGRGIAAGACVAALASAGLGCGAQEHPNEPRPAPPTRISVAISRDSITVQPSKIGFGPEPNTLVQQNQGQPQPPIHTKEPLDVTIVSANLTPTDSKLVINGPKDLESGLLVANGNGTYQASLPTGNYRITAADIPGAAAATLRVGSYRASSQNDVLLP
jgi:hypothetical protein